MMLGPAAAGREALASLGTGTAGCLVAWASALVGWAGETIDAGTYL